MALILVAVFLVGVFLFSPRYPRWLGPRHVHAIALAVGVIAGGIPWRSGTMPARVPARLATLVVPIAAVYYFYFRMGESSRAPSMPDSSDDARNPPDPEV